jgi:uncharacterized protein
VVCILVNKNPNELINEKSPYLLQHAYNPVNWHSWGEKAFEIAKAEDKPIFLSIGYSTCHWCHVMEDESFEDEEVAKILNDNYISVKVDREERPDVDSVYMTFCQAMTGSGGWPLTIIMTPDKKPFFAGTYFPKYQRYNRIGLIDLLKQIDFKWKNEKETLLKSSENILSILKEDFEVNRSEGEIDKGIIDEAAEAFKLLYDNKHGGFGRAPKFPSPQNLMFLMKYYHLEDDEQSLDMVEKTLKGMYKGGLFDHIGYGFSRYSTDDKWLVPHFEKMLYDNAMLIIAYLEAYRITKNDLYKNIVIKTIDYVIRELTDESGGFYCAQDADSEGEEGKFYVFNQSEIVKILGEEDGLYFNEYYDITNSGNFEGKSIPNLINNRKYYEEDKKIDKLRENIFDYRLKRTDLHKDDKILTSWNGLMIVALAKAYEVLKDERYLNHANKALDFIKNNLVNSEGRLLARYREGQADHLAYLDDYSFLIWACISMYEATFESRYLKEAIDLNNKTIELFWDEKNYGFFIYGKDGENLIARPKDLYDGAKPSGNSVATYNLIKLARMTKNQSLENIAYDQIKVYGNSLEKSPTGYSFYMLALMYELYPSKELVCVIKNSEDLKVLKDILTNNYLPNINVVVKKEYNLDDINIYLNDYKTINDLTTYYLCEGNSCSKPFNEINILKEYLGIL